MRILANFPDDNPRPRRYDYRLIFDGHIRELEPGIDFTCQPASLVGTMRGAARRRGIAVEIRRYVRPEDEQVVVAVKAERST
jgi:hypothetical protein